MEMREACPFIYFLIEPNVVFVYEIETQRYVTVHDLLHSEGCKTYKLDNGEDFAAFDHKEHKPLVGRGHIVDQHILNLMVEKINQQIQSHRKSGLINKDFSPVHIVCSEYAAGTLRVALKSPKLVIGFPEIFSIGPLWKLEGKIGRISRNEWLSEHINLEGEDFEYENKLANTIREIEDIPGHISINIWYADNVEEQIGVTFILYLLRHKSNEIILINSTKLYRTYVTPRLEDQTILHTGNIQPDHLRLIFQKSKMTKPLSCKKRMQFEKEWETLSQTKKVLRIWMNNRIKSVPEHYYDPLIMNTIEKMHKEQTKKAFIKAGEVIGEIISIKKNQFIQPFFLEYRIRHLIYHGVLQLKGIPKSMRHYSVKL